MPMLFSFQLQCLKFYAKTAKMILNYCIIRLTAIFVLCWKQIHCHERCMGIISGNYSFCSVTSILDVAESLLHSAKLCAKTSINAECLISNPMDCAEIHERDPSSKSGIFNIWPRSRVIKGPVKVYCDMDDEGGAWTVIQRRGNFDSPIDYFYRDWNSYKNGFGDLSKDFWLGNDNIYALTNERDNLLKFILEDFEGNRTYAAYDEFWIDDEDHNFTAHVSGYRGQAGDSFSFTNGKPFTTKDRDNDDYTNNCAVLYKGAWWYTACHSSNLNGFYLKGAHESYADGVEWSSFRGQKYSLKDTIIKIRPKSFTKSIDFDVTPQ